MKTILTFLLSGVLTISAYAQNNITYAGDTVIAKSVQRLKKILNLNETQQRQITQARKTGRACMDSIIRKPEYPSDGRKRLMKTCVENYRAQLQLILTVEQMTALTLDEKARADSSLKNKTGG